MKWKPKSGILINLIMSPATIYWFDVVHIAIIVKFEQTSQHISHLFSVFPLLVALNNKMAARLIMSR